MLKQQIYTVLITLLTIGCANTSGDTNAELGIDYYQNGAYEKAKTELKTALGKELTIHSKQEAHTFLGNIYSDQDLYDSSIFHYKNALAIDSSYSNALVNLGIVYRLISEFDLAEDCYQKAMKVNPDNPNLFASLGALYIFKGEGETAISNLEKAINLDPQLVVAHSNYALALAMVGRFEEADEELKKAVAMGYKNGPIIKDRIDELRKLE